MPNGQSCNSGTKREQKGDEETRGGVGVGAVEHGVQQSLYEQ